MAFAGDPDDGQTVELGQEHGHPGVGRKSPARLVIGEVLAARFRISAYLGEGGIGQVYEAEDLELGGRLALKVLHPAIAHDERAVLRFKREVQLARQVTHSAVCRVFDLSHHLRRREPGGLVSDVAGDVVFLTMELLPGEPLSERLARDGKMPAGEALPLAGQMAAGLAAAHAAGVVHRDFKSGNVMLVPATAGTRAVITDFGLASSSTASSSLTGTTTLVGSPAYMSPEQVTGAEITAASDIYSFGIVLFEMVTGTLPFQGETALGVALKRLEEPPPSLRAVAPDLDARWEAAILGCLARDPKLRFASADEVAAVLAGGRAAPRRARRPRRRLAAVAAALALPVAVALALPVFHRLRRPEGAAGSAGSANSPGEAGPGGVAARRASVAVIGFQNLSHDPAGSYLDGVLREMLPTELAGGGRLLAVSSEEVERLRRDLALPAAGSLAGATLERVRRMIGADYVVAGSYLVVPRPAAAPDIRLDLRVQDTASGATLAAFKEEGSEQAILETLARSGVELRRALGVPALSDAQERELQAAQPRSGDAARLYAEGLARLRLSDAPAARQLLERAVGADPGNPMIRSALASAWSALGYDRRAEEAAREAFRLSAGLPRAEQRLIEARYRAAAGQWERAAEIYGALWNFYPDQLDYGLHLAAAQTNGGNGSAALATIEKLRRLPRPAGDDPRIDLAEAAAAAALTDLKRQQRAAATAAQKAAGRGARDMLAEARFLEGQARDGLGDLAAARTAYVEASRIDHELGDRAGETRVLHATALLLLGHGDTAAGEARLAEALAAYRAIGNTSGEAKALRDLGQAKLNRGQLAEARTQLEGALALSRQTGDQLGIFQALSLLGHVFREQGDFNAAQVRYAEALRVSRETGNRDQEAKALNSLAFLQRAKGDLKAARESLGEALAAFRAIGDRRSEASSLANLGIILLDLGDLSGAAASHREAIAICRELGLRGALAVNIYALAEIDLFRGDFTAARRGAEEATTLFRDLGFGDRSAASQLLVGEVALETGRMAEARTLAHDAAGRFAAAGAREQEATALALEAQALVRSGGAPAAKAAALVIGRSLGLLGNDVSDNRLAIEMVAAEVEAARGHPAAAVRHLRTELGRDQAVRLPLQLEARLVLGRAEVAAGDLAGGRATLAALAAEAGARGFAHLAQEAAAPPMPPIAPLAPSAPPESRTRAAGTRQPG